MDFWAQGSKGVRIPAGSERAGARTKRMIQATFPCFTLGGQVDADPTPRASKNRLPEHGSSPKRDRYFLESSHISPTEAQVLFHCVMLHVSRHSYDYF